jgi:mono/diheme cytochrome c family protein/uncharacterized membrane protein YozB (DUF420 family)
MYGLTLLVHSWLRWLLLLVALVVLLRALRGVLFKAAWSERDLRLSRAFVGLVDLQLVLGLVLYVILSPIVEIALSDLRAAMKSSVLRFFAVEHITAMLIAVAVAHVGKVRAQRATTDSARHRNMLVTIGVWLVVVLIGIPWPFRPYGRPLVRTTVSSGEGASAPASSTYATRCAVCHGASGHGDGIAAGTMNPPPRDFRDAAFQRSSADEQLRTLIAQGGPASGLSANMPAHPDLSRAQLDELVQFVRACATRP